MTTDLSLALLGPPVVRRDGAPVTFDTRKATALLALLAVTGREQLAGLLWPDADSAKGRASLRTRLQAVGEPTRQLLTAAAVLGRDNDADLLRAVSGRGEDEIIEAIDEALARSLLTTSTGWPRCTPTWPTCCTPTASATPR